MWNGCCSRVSGQSKYIFDCYTCICPLSYVLPLIFASLSRMIMELINWTKWLSLTVKHFDSTLRELSQWQILFFLFLLIPDSDCHSGIQFSCKLPQNTGFYIAFYIYCFLYILWTLLLDFVIGQGSWILLFMRIERATQIWKLFKTLDMCLIKITRKP